LCGSASLLWLGSTWAAPPADPSSIWTLQGDNTSISTAKLTDRYYVNGLSLGWASPTDQVPGLMAALGNALWGDGQQRIGFLLSQQMYTRPALSLPSPIHATGATEACCWAIYPSLAIRTGRAAS